ncbi:hypothetical protein LW135_00440 [Helicobacter sp. faydin-H20]|uniref:hypothetical protein n=1 Tax=Helicobacter anatolicus TaxID=2905874 RepID=UPI001E3DB0F6|nr:hypothetical protein [Helicobacter anatolicus]MCE3036300.1 hypothetical protein [Helicobacter anatolicus]
MRIFLYFLSLCFLWGKSYIISPLPTPRQEVLDIVNQDCNIQCLQKFYEQQEYFSFVAKFDSKLKDQDLRAKLTGILSELNLFMSESFFENIQNSKKIKIALLVPRDVVGRYSAIGVNAILTYLTSRDVTYLFEVFDSKNEELEALHQTYEEIKQKKFDCVVAMLTQNGVEKLLEDTEITLPTYVPTVNKKQVMSKNIPEKLFFGGIDYEEQIKILYDFAKTEEIVEYDDASNIGNWLKSLSQKVGFNVIFGESITNERAAKFSQDLKNQEEILANRDVLLNIPVIKTGLILPQIGFLEEKPKRFLSTQINYNPSLLMLVKPKDRAQFFIVNAIGRTNNYLLGYGLLLGSDFQYDWVSYSIGIGVEIFFLNRGEKISKFFSETLENGQIQYANKIYRTYKNGFREVK